MKRAKFLFIKILFCTILALTVSINSNAAQTPAPTSTPIPTLISTPTSRSPSASTPSSDVRVIDVYRAGQKMIFSPMVMAV